MSVQLKSRVDEGDDLDDLDDVLDQFSQPAPPASGSIAQPAPANVSASNQPPTDMREALPDDLAEELASEMESLLRGLGDVATSEGTNGAAAQKQLAAAWEAMLVEGMNAMSDPSASASCARTPADASSSRPAGADFQSRIRSAMNRLRESESGLQPSDAPSSGDGENLKSLLSQLQALGNNSDGEESEEQLQGVLEEMMGQLMSKDVLYEPLKELHEKFPGYLAEHASTISDGDKKRYEAQISCIKRLIDEFEASTYRDEDPMPREKIVELMSELQTHGQPPAEIMGPLPPGLNLGGDGLLDEDCNVN